MKAWNDAPCSATVYSDEAELTVPKDPIFFDYQQPASTTVCETYPATFEAYPFYANTYQWEKFDGTTWIELTDTHVYQGMNTNKLTVIETIYTELHKVLFRLAARNLGCPRSGVHSDPVELYIIPSPVFPGIPDATVCIGEDYTYSLNNIQYSDEWRWEAFNGTTWVEIQENYTGPSGDNYQGVTTTKLRIKNANLTMAYNDFRIKARNEGCPPTWQYSSPSEIHVPVEPVFNEAVSNHTACIDYPYSFISTPENANEWQWQIKPEAGNWTDIKTGIENLNNYDGYNTQTLTIKNSGLLIGNNQFRMKARNDGCPRTWVFSAIRNLHVPEMPGATTSNVTVCENYGFTFSPAYSNANEYQWEVILSSDYNEDNFQDITASTYGGKFSNFKTSQLELNSATLDMHEFWFRLKLKNDGCPYSWYKSEPFQLWIDRQPIINSVTPKQTTVCEDETYHVSADISYSNEY